ncbi:hypothetical protein SAY87_021207 [Trapa incisa]|uniref:Uncharacterized protein n=1 Tax=Trapa incisa TaxID=236973 RepID=A0AAN7JRQ0_9MYRT|nr:hypothetical protein SAY87_021207 [Trapa incisa]
MRSTQYPTMLLCSALLFFLLPLLWIPHLSGADSVVGSAAHFRNGSAADHGLLLSAEELMLDPWRSTKASSSKILSYDALRRNQPICRSTAYSSNCIPPKVNDYTNPCAKIYHCRG